MEVAGVLSIVGLCFAGVMFLLIRRVWLRYRVIAIAISSGSDPQAFSYKLTEAIRTLGYRETPESGSPGVFQGPAWMRWSTGLQNISVEPSEGGAVLVTGPAFWVSFVGRRFTGVTPRPYAGCQPVWPLLKGVLRLFGIGVATLFALGLALYLFGN
jgi:hypothetical protein